MKKISFNLEQVKGMYEAGSTLRNICLLYNNCSQGVLSKGKRPSLEIISNTSFINELKKELLRLFNVDTKTRLCNKSDKMSELFITKIQDCVAFIEQIYIGKTIYLDRKLATATEIIELYKDHPDYRTREKHD